MIASVIQLEQYFLSSFNYSVNPDFDPEEAVEIKFSDISEEHSIHPLNEDALTEWQVDLKVGFVPVGISNAPYSFSSHIVGLFSISDTVEKEKIPSLIEANATSVLYSTLREIVNTITAKGPYFPLLLPTLCYFQQKDDSCENG